MGKVLATSMPGWIRMVASLTIAFIAVMVVVIMALSLFGEKPKSFGAHSIDQNYLEMRWI